MVTIKHIKDVSLTIGAETKSEEAFGIFNSCRLCPSGGRGIYKVEDSIKKESYHLCEKHKPCFDDTAKDLSPEIKKALANDSESIAAEVADKEKPDIFTTAAAKDKTEGAAA